MTAITWDKIGSKQFETGVDHAVLYLSDGTAVPWNGLTGIIENESRVEKSYYLDGRKYLDVQTPGDFAATLKAITYPEEFGYINGDADFIDGITLKDQPVQPFSLSYQTRTGSDNDLDATGYKIHVIFQVMALPTDKDYETLGSVVAPLEFSWVLSSTPSLLAGRRPTAHIVIDSTKTEEFVLAKIEAILYGSDTVNPSLTDLQTLLDAAQTVVTLTVTDNGDGTFSITGPDEYFSMLTGEEFQVIDIDATFFDADTYSATDTLIHP
jgi:hypothetical protein